MENPCKNNVSFISCRDDTKCWIHHFGAPELPSKTQQVVHKQTHHKYMETVRVYLYLRSIIYVYLSAAQLLLSLTFGPVPQYARSRASALPCMVSRRTQNPALLPGLTATA